MLPTFAYIAGVPRPRRFADVMENASAHAPLASAPTRRRKTDVLAIMRTRKMREPLLLNAVAFIPLKHVTSDTARTFR